MAQKFTISKATQVLIQ